jgi:hypothetical protein
VNDFVEKDSPRYQQDRIKQLVLSKYPSLTIEFEHAGSMRFRLLKEGRILGSVNEQEKPLVTEMADKSDSALILLIDSVLNRSVDL